MYDLHRGGDVLRRITDIISRYLKISGEIKELAGGIDGSTEGTLKLFLVEARMNIWLIALGTLMNRVLETFFYPLLKSSPGNDRLIWQFSRRPSSPS